MGSTELKFLHLKPQHQYYIEAKISNVGTAEEIANYVSDKMGLVGEERYSTRTVHDWNITPKIQAALVQAQEIDKMLKQGVQPARKTVVGVDPKAVAHTIQESVSVSGTANPLLLVKLKQAATDGMDGLLDSIEILKDIQANEKIFPQHRVAAAKALLEITQMALKESGTITATMSQSSSTAAADTTFSLEHIQTIKDALLGPKIKPGQQEALEVTVNGNEPIEATIHREERTERSQEESLDPDLF